MVKPVFHSDYLQHCVCEKHFLKEDYKWTPTGRKLLKPDAVPSGINWSKEKTMRPSPRNRLRIDSKESHELLFDFLWKV